ncbi:hypothetical protein [Uliginosibacterium sp. 31-12]|jgi:hypothetical protein|uniref:hypothetical protein n=1 Tax=Uliginosibacterium sp. 31-12 TaxID=3062781 RepID=UPI0026E23B5B|nr:hypothetical protein [Uliginosibacterium sp. 31-12]MDO6384738.1 hypothetical protein [Uliginosibacterium sp. 31-12]
MTVFVFDSEAASLAVCADPAAALQGRAVADLRAQRWLFFGVDGEPLRVDCLADGTSQLRPWASCASCRLVQVLPWVEHFETTSEWPDLQRVRESLGE